MLESEWTDRDRLSVDISKGPQDQKRKHMSQLVQLRLYSGTQYALCRCQHSEAPDTKQRSFLCKSLGRQAGGLLCVTWYADGKVVLNMFELFSSNVCTPSAQTPPSLPYLWKVPFLGHQFSALCAVHPMPCSVQRGPHLDRCSILDMFVCNLENASPFSRWYLKNILAVAQRAETLSYIVPY